MLNEEVNYVTNKVPTPSTIQQIEVGRRPKSAYQGRKMKKDKSMAILTKEVLLNQLKDERAGIMQNRIHMHDMKEQINRCLKALHRTQRKSLKRQPNIFKPPKNNIESMSSNYGFTKKDSLGKSLSSHTLKSRQKMKLEAGSKQFSSNYEDISVIDDAASTQWGVGGV
jgi:hypothetical protein